MAPAKRGPAPPGVLTVVNPSGHRTRIPVQPLPFRIGRHSDNDLVLRDNRVSRIHAQVSLEEEEFWIEDLKSRHGVFVNGSRVQGRQKLGNADRIDFGIRDSYHLVFNIEDAELSRLLDQISPPSSGTSQGAGNLAKLRALVEVARVMQSSLSTQDVLAAVVDAALAVTGSERGFLLLKEQDELEVRVARHRRGMPLPATELRVPTRLIHRALTQRRELLSMNFDPNDEAGVLPDISVADLELSSVVCLPLVRIRTGSSEDTRIISSAHETAGMIYMDSRRGPADLSAGNRELLQTLALEASTILENARLLEQERAKLKMEEELNVARAIQQGLLPKALPHAGWFRASGSSIASHQVGGDYYDVRQIRENAWCAVVADVSGKGVSSALLASLLQGAFLLASEGQVEIEEMMNRINHFLNERTQGDKYATIFYCVLDADGNLQWANAGHCAPLLLRTGGEIEELKPTGMPVGLLETASYSVEDTRLNRGDKLILYTDGFSEATNEAGDFFEQKRLRELLRVNARLNSAELHQAMMRAVEEFTDGAEQSDDITMVVLEYASES